MHIIHCTTYELVELFYHCFYDGYTDNDLIPYGEFFWAVLEQLQGDATKFTLMWTVKQSVSPDLFSYHANITAESTM